MKTDLSVMRDMLGKGVFRKAATAPAPVDPNGVPTGMPQAMPGGVQSPGMPPGMPPAMPAGMPGGMPGGMPPEMMGGMPPEMMGGMPPGGAMPPEMGGMPGGMPNMDELGALLGMAPGGAPQGAPGMDAEAAPPLEDPAAEEEEDAADSEKARKGEDTDAMLREIIAQNEALLERIRNLEETVAAKDEYDPELDLEDTPDLPEPEFGGDVLDLQPKVAESEEEAPGMIRGALSKWFGRTNS